MSRNGRGLHIQTHRLMKGIYEVTVEMVLGAMGYIPSFIKIGLGIQKLMMGGGTQRHGMVIA
jgi:hypothetical protein